MSQMLEAFEGQREFLHEPHEAELYHCFPILVAAGCLCLAGTEVAADADGSLRCRGRKRWYLDGC